MTRLGAVISQAIVHHYGRDELLRRLAHPFWSQSFGAVMGMDWHSSGITTSMIDALKRGLKRLNTNSACMCAAVAASTRAIRLMNSCPFAVMVAPPTASVLSSVTSSDDGLASGINNATSRVAQLAGVAIAAGLGASSSGWQWGMFAAAAFSASGALITALEVPSAR